MLEARDDAVKGHDSEDDSDDDCDERFELTVGELVEGSDEHDARGGALLDADALHFGRVASSSSSSSNELWRTFWLCIGLSPPLSTLRKGIFLNGREEWPFPVLELMMIESLV